MSYVCDDCGEYLGGYGHYGMVCNQCKVPARLAAEIVDQTPFDISIVTAAIIQAGYLIRVNYDNNYYHGLNWNKNAPTVKRTALNLLHITDATNIRIEAGL